MQNMKQNYSLNLLNTLHLSSQARYYIALSDIGQLADIVNFAKNLDIFVLGGGSNIILPEIYTGLILHNNLKGIKLLETCNYYVLVKVMAGEVWDSFVEYTLQHSCYGLENLSLIPGTVGASPIQNIGAYGVEVKDFIHSVEVYDIEKQEFRQLSNEQCQFKYRGSFLKDNPNLIVISVVFRLWRTPKLNINYADIAGAMQGMRNPTALDLRNYVIQIRQNKLPNPAIIGNVGSFFHNPILDILQVKQLQEQYPNIPVYCLNDKQAKVSAAWLIDNLGLKGYRQGNVGIYPKQALVLVNYGGATAAELLNFAYYIQAKIQATYSIKLEIEPLIINN
jgi:UDP-N-acetylmuramate dehydrogenase